MAGCVFYARLYRAFTKPCHQPSPGTTGHIPRVNAIQRAFQALQRGDNSRSGVMLHLVPDEDVNAGPLLAQREVDIQNDHTVETFQKRIHDCEYLLLVETLRKLSAHLEDQNA